MQPIKFNAYDPGDEGENISGEAGSKYIGGDNDRNHASTCDDRVVEGVP